MPFVHSSVPPPARAPALAAIALLVAVVPGSSQQPPAAAEADQAQSFTVFVRSQPIGRETVWVVRQPTGWVIRGSNRLGPPLDVVTHTAEIVYDAAWRPARMRLDGTTRGRAVTIDTLFENGQASSTISVDGTQSSETDPVAADTLVLPNSFLGSYAALARRLVGSDAGASFRGYIVPQGEVAIRVDGVFAERIETPRRAIAATRYAVTIVNAPPAAGVPMSIWTDLDGSLLRISVPAQALEVARDDVASAAARTTSFHVPGDEAVRIPASGFSLAASVTRPPAASGRLPAVVLVSDSNALDRDGVMAGVPVMGQIAASLAEAGFLVVRYDRRGVGQSGGRAETATLRDYAEDVRAVIEWLVDELDDVDEDRIAVAGHGDGAWVAMQAAARDRRIDALVLIGAAATTGAELVLEQQQRLLEAAGASEPDRQAKIDLQKRINAAVLEGAGWEQIPEEYRRAADTAWFQSYLAFDPAEVMRDVRQPVLVVHGSLDREVPALHATRLGEIARARRRREATQEIVIVSGVNHLLVPATSGAVGEYASLADRRVSPDVGAAIAKWLASTFSSPS